MRNLTNESFKKKFFALIAIILMMTSAMLVSATFIMQTAKASSSGLIPGSPMQGATSGVVGALGAGITPTISVNPVAFLSFSPNPIGLGQHC